MKQVLETILSIVGVVVGVRVLIAFVTMQRSILRFILRPSAATRVRRRLEQERRREYTEAVQNLPAAKAELEIAQAQFETARAEAIEKYGKKNLDLMMELQALQKLENKLKNFNLQQNDAGAE